MFGAHDLPYLYPEQVKSFFQLPMIWSEKNHEAFGLYNVSILWNWPIEFLYGLGGRIGIDYNLLIILFGLLPFVVFGSTGLYRLLSEYKLSKKTITVTIIFFLLNPFTLLLIDGGQLNLAVAYALLPLAFSYRKNLKNFLWTCVAISIFDLRIILFLEMLLGARAILSPSEIKPIFKNVFLSLIVLFICHLYWILPAAIVKLPSLPESYTESSQIDTLSFAKLSDSIIFYQPHWPKNIFGQLTTPAIGLIVLPVIVFFALLTKKDNNAISYWCFVSILGVFLSKGSNPPLINIYKYLFINIPGFNLFRDPIKFYMFIGLGYSILLAFSIEYIQQRKNKIFYFLVVMYLLFICAPIIKNEFTGLLSLPRSMQGYISLANSLSKSSPGKIVWIPSKPSIGYSDVKHPSSDALTFLDKQPIEVNIKGTYETLNYLREPTEIGKVFPAIGIKYLAISAIDSKRDSTKPEDIRYHQFLINEIIKNDWTEKSELFNDVNLIQVKTPEDFFSLKSQVIFVSGSQYIYKSFSSLKHTGIVFTDLIPELSLRLAEYPSAIMSHEHGSISNKISGYIPSKNLIKLTDLLNETPDKTGWWKRNSSEIVWWRDFLKNKYNIENSDFDPNQGWSISEGAHKLDFKTKNCSDCYLFIKVLQSTAGGDIKIYQNNKELIKLNTKDDSNSFNWFNVRLESDKDKITLSTDGDLNVVNTIATISQTQLTNFSEYYQSATINSRKISPQTSQIKLLSKKINPTLYKIKISGIKNPIMLTMSQNYDSNWRLSGQKSLPVYGLINGFSITKDGEYTIEYYPQKYVYSGLIISLVTGIMVSSLKLFRTLWKRKTTIITSKSITN